MPPPTTIVDLTVAATADFYIYAASFSPTDPDTIIIGSFLFHAAGSIEPNPEQTDNFKDQQLDTATGQSGSPTYDVYRVSANGTGLVAKTGSEFFFYSNVPLNLGTELPVDETTIWDPSAVCFLRGTLLRTPDGNVAVEDLRIGDLLLVHGTGEHGQGRASMPIRWIGRSTYALPFASRNRRVIPICIRAGAVEDGLPDQDLWVSPRHCLLIDGALVPAERLLNGVTIIQPPPPRIDYFHIELDRHECILSAGLWSESFLDNGSRFRFHNAAEHDAVVRGSAVPFPSPLLENGPELVRRLLKLCARAGMANAAGPLIGHVDVLETDRIVGWALGTDNPDMPVILDILLDDEPITSVVACHVRPDVQRAGFGRGRSGFAAELPPGRVAPEDLVRLTVRRQSDGALLRNPTGRLRSA